MQQNINSLVKGTSLVISHFGNWPSFHDAEIVRMDLRREGASMEFQIFGFKTLNVIDDKGCFKREKQCIITFLLSGIEAFELRDFNQQNVLSDLEFEKVGTKTRVVLNSVFGASGHILCAQAEVLSLKPLQ